jgi:YHS domain-containing protein
MFKNPYRPCPICRTQLERRPEKDSGNGWEWYFCNQNCGSHVCVQPFAVKVDRKGDRDPQGPASE